MTETPESSVEPPSVEPPSVEPLSADEILDVVDADDHVVGQATRGEVMARGLRHRCVFILATDADGRIFVHRRTPQKIVFPSLYDVFVGGVVGAGESYDEAAKREAEEELGVTGIEPEHLFTFLYSSADSSSADHEWFSAVYRATTPVTVSPQREEVAWHAFLTEAELEAALPGWDVVPDGMEAWRRWEEWQASMARRISRPEASAAVSELGWRYLLGTLRTTVPVGSLAEAASVAARAARVCGRDADDHLRVELRRDLAVLSLQSAAVATVTGRDLDLARRLSAALSTQPRPLQVVELGIDALDIASIRPFWKAVLGYTDEPGLDGPTDALVDPLGHGPSVWFQQMDAPRPQRNRIHFDVCVPHDEAADRIAATLAAGGKLVYDAEAPAFWVLADPEGNEACVTTWQGRD